MRHALRTPVRAASLPRVPPPAPAPRAMSEPGCGSLRPPARVRGLKLLDRSLFKQAASLPALTLPEGRLSALTTCLRNYFLKLNNFKPVQPVTGTTFKYIFLDPDKVRCWEDIDELVRSKLLEHAVDESNLDFKTVHLTYDNWRSDQIFKAVLDNEEGVSGFSQVGHIVHLNLRDHLLEYKSLIGEVLLDKIKICRTVVNKINSIDSTYRNFAMELIAGEENYQVTVKENNSIFEFDFSKVYWNPRLGKEHERILAELNPGDVLFDVFCGVGPFAIPALKKKCKVFANDLNPDSFKWLNHNAKRNKVNSELFKSYNVDGKDFIKDRFRRYITDIFTGSEVLSGNSKIHVTMNLPAIAVEFLASFKGLLRDVTFPENQCVEIIVHVYCFAFGDTPEATAKEMVNKNMGVDLTSHIIEVFNVRNVSPKKEMMRVSFRLTKDVLKYVDVIKENSEEFEPPSKKQCTSNTHIGL